MVCSPEAYQLSQMRPHRPDLAAEKNMEMPWTEHACSVDPVQLKDQVDAC